MRSDPPPLDTATADGLLDAARQHLKKIEARWQASAAADPGVALLEAVACIAEAEIARINALPDAMEDRLLQMLGVPRVPGKAASAMLEFALEGPRSSDTLVPAGQRVGTGDGSGAIFTLIRDVVIPAGATSGSGLAAEVVRIPRRIVGTASGAPAQEIDLPHDNLPGAPDEVAGIELLVRWPGQPPDDAEIVTMDGAGHVRYREAPTDRLVDGGHLFVADRAAGVLRLPGAGPCLPPAGARILAAYFVLPEASAAPPLAGTLTEALDPPLPGVQVTNSRAAAPGMSVESAAALLSRGPVAALIGGQAIQARDYEELARGVRRDVARAHAFATAENWSFAPPGSVTVLLAPRVDRSRVGAIREDESRVAWPEALREAMDHPQTGGQILPAIRRRLEAASPMGVRLDVEWLKAKPVGVSCRVYVAPGAEDDGVRDAVRRRLDDFLSPLPTDLQPGGWPLGRPLHQSELIEALQAVPGVRTVDKVVMRPRFPMTGSVTALAADAGQPGTWFAAIGGILYRTLNDGRAWTRVLSGDDLDGGTIAATATHPVQSGLVAAALSDGRIMVSHDRGASFGLFSTAAFAPALLHWVSGGECPRLLIAGAGDLCESAGPAEGRPPGPARGLHCDDGSIGPAAAIATLVTERGSRLVAVARRPLGGIVLSNDAGREGTFRTVRLADHDVRALAFVCDADGTCWLCAGCARPVVDGQEVALIARVDDDACEIGPWQAASDGWPGGGMSSLGVVGTTLIATRPAGGLVLGTVSPDGSVLWETPPPGIGLPMSADGRSLAPLDLVCVSKEGQIAIGGDNAIAISTRPDPQTEMTFRDVGVRDGAERIAIPPDWVICGDGYDIEVKDVAG